MSTGGPQATGKQLLKAPKGAFLLQLALLPWMKHGLTINGLESFPTDFMFLVAMALWLAALAAGHARLRLHRSFHLLGLYLAALAVSAIFSVNQHVSEFKLLTEVYLLLLPVLAYNLVESEAYLKRAFGVGFLRRWRLALKEWPRWCCSLFLDGTLSSSSRFIMSGPCLSALPADRACV